MSVAGHVPAGDAAGMVPAVAGFALHRANQCQPVDAARNGAGGILGLAWHRQAAKPDDAGLAAIVLVTLAS